MTATLVDAALAAGVGRYVQESVSMIYCDGGTDWVDEDQPTDGLAPPSQLARLLARLEG